jgi:hypothetical protein
VVAQGKAKDKALSTAFVTFKDTFATTIAATSMMHHDLRHWSTREAPAPRVCIPAWDFCDSFGFQGLLPYVTCCTAVSMSWYAATAEYVSKHCYCSIIITTAVQGPCLTAIQFMNDKHRCPFAMCASPGDHCSVLTQQREVFHAASQR